MCILLYDDRVNTYHRMQEIDVLIDDQTELALELVNLDIRNVQAHNELQSYNQDGNFLLIHPLVVKSKYQEDQRLKLRNIQKETPDLFLKEISNTTQNIKRIESNIRTKKYKDEAEHQSWLENLEKAQIKRNIILNLLK